MLGQMRATRCDEAAVAGCRALLAGAARRGYPVARLAHYSTARASDADWLIRVAIGLAARCQGWSYTALALATGGKIPATRWQNWRHNVETRLLVPATKLACDLADGTPGDSVTAPPAQHCDAGQPLIHVDPEEQAFFLTTVVPRFEDDPAAVLADLEGVAPRGEVNAARPEAWLSRGDA
jgi:3-oxoacyl-ACP reductase-like protein